MRFAWGQLAAAFALAASTEARAGILAYFKDYQPGAEYTSSRSASSLEYDATVPANAAGRLPNGCDIPVGSKTPQTMHCKATIAEPSTIGWGLFAQKAFKRQGWAFFEPGIAFSLVTLDGKYDQQKERKEQQLAQQPGIDLSAPNAPLDTAALRMYGLNTKGYLQFGLTPRYVPDLLLSLGLGAQAAVGEITVQGKKERFGAFLPLAYYELELVWARFGAGALSTYVSVDGDTGKKKLYDKPIKGMKHFALSQSSQTVGLIKFVCPWP